MDIPLTRVSNHSRSPLNDKNLIITKITEAFKRRVCASNPSRNDSIPMFCEEPAMGFTRPLRRGYGGLCSPACAGSLDLERRLRPPRTSSQFCAAEAPMSRVHSHGTPTWAFVTPILAPNVGIVRSACWKTRTGLLPVFRDSGLGSGFCPPVTLKLFCSAAPR